MDDVWFNDVGRRLQEIEQEKINHLAGTHEINRDLHLHPLIIHSRFWHKTDEFVSCEYFDWQAPRYPTQYHHHLKRESESALLVLAERAYHGTLYSLIENKVENQKTLMARIILLKIEYLLPLDIS
jgi:hypothetical protein